MTDEIAEDLAEIKMLAALIFDTEQGKFKSIRKRRMALDEQRRRLQFMMDLARARAGGELSDIPVLLAYLKALTGQVARLHEEDETLVAQENNQKAQLKTALARQLRLEDDDRP